jgi:hypothetical protein
MSKVDTDKAYLLGLLLGGGIVQGDTMQIVLPYKNWGDLQINPTRAGGIAEDILSRLNPLWTAHYDMSVSYKVGTDWKIICNKISDKLKNDLVEFGLPNQGELRYSARLEKIHPLLTSLEHKKNFITGLVDTIGSLAASHRRFVSDFQIISFEFKGNNFDLVSDVARILIDIGCIPDQILWNHPNQHSGTCRYYKSWKKGFKVRVALDDYMLNGGFVFKSKKLSAEENKSLQKSGLNTTQGKPVKISGRVTLHKDENSSWLPPSVRGGHFIHNLHFYRVLGLPTPANFGIDSYLQDFENYFCPFTCLSKGDFEELQKIIEDEPYLQKTTFSEKKLNVSYLIEKHKQDASGLVFGKSENTDGFPITYLLQGIAYIMAATKNEGIKGKRVLGNYLDVIEKHKDMPLMIGYPDRGTCVLLHNNQFAALVGYVNPQFNKNLIQKIEGAKVYLREPSYEECIKL